MAIITVEYLSKALKRNVTYKIVLPNDNLDSKNEYIKNPKKFKTLYLLNGYYGNCSDWLYYSRIEVYARENNLCVVMPSGENSFYVDALSGDNNYSEFIGKELVMKTREIFPLSNKKEDTFIGGLSMGGYGAIINGLKYNDTFGYVIGLSNATNMFNEYTNTFYNEEFIFKDIESARNSSLNPKYFIDNCDNIKALPKFYMACGLQDDLYKCNVDLKDYFVSKGLDVVWDETDGTHNWYFWDSQILKAIKLLPLNYED